MTIEQHMAAVRKDRKNGMEALVDAIQTDTGFAQSVTQRLALYRDMEKANRMQACWISKTINETLMAALAIIKTHPGVPVGG